MGDSWTRELGGSIDRCCLGEGELTGATGPGIGAGRDFPTQHLRAAQSQGRHSVLAIAKPAIPAPALWASTRTAANHMAITALILTF